MTSPLSLGRRALDVALAQVGVAEDPPGSNTGPMIREYLSMCVRGNSAKPLGLTASNWCMAFASWCQWKALNYGERPAHGYRAGVVEAVADVRLATGPWTGSWKPVDVVRSGSWTPIPGDLAIWDRSVAGKPETSWYRHVSRVSEWRSNSFVTVGGNEQGEVRVSTHPILAPNLLGFIAYSRVSEKPERPLISEEERERVLALVALTNDGIMRDSLIDSDDLLIHVLDEDK